jgi:putative transposase
MAVMLALGTVPWHGPPHYEGDGQVYLISAACYEHKSVIGLSAARMAEFESDLLEVAQSACQQVFAWVVLPNHYHFLGHAPEIETSISPTTAAGWARAASSP